MVPLGQAGHLGGGLGGFAGSGTPQGTCTASSPHPFAADAGQVLAGLGVRPARQTDVVLVLPSGPGPLPSPEITLDALLPGDETAVADDRAPEPPAAAPAAWTVPAVDVTADEALTIVRALATVAGAGGPQTRVLGASMRHLIALVDFANDLVTRGRVLPSARRVPAAPSGPVGQDDQVALWLPVLTGADALWARSLALAQPAAFRAVEGDGTADGRRRGRAARRPGGRDRARAPGCAEDRSRQQGGR